MSKPRIAKRAGLWEVVNYPPSMTAALREARANRQRQWHSEAWSWCLRMNVQGTPSGRVRRPPELERPV